MEIDLHNYAGISADSRKIRDNFIYVAVKGTHVDGHKFISNAVASGATLVVCEVAQEGVKSLVVADSRLALNLLLRDFYGRPDEDLELFGVTGTNGKSTSVMLVDDFLRRSGVATGLISTIEFRTPKSVSEATHTTPDGERFFSMLSQAKAEGAKVISMELSSHALDQRRVDGVQFKVGLFTNLTGDHLDYHGTFAHYFAAKKRLFLELLAPHGVGVINIDDPYGALLTQELPHAVTFGSSQRADCHISNIELVATESRFSLDYRGKCYNITTSMAGRHNIFNLVGAMLSAEVLGVNWDNLCEYAQNPCAVAGRLERLTLNSGAVVMIDYAHTDDALQQVLNALRPLTTKRLITVFGCGGDRDKSKRPRMGRVATRYSDVAILTSDNPRSEDPQVIANDVLSGVDNSENLILELDRAKAIKLACSMADAGDVVLIAGKGHEQSQEIAGEKFHFSDREQVEAICRCKTC